MRYDGSVVLSSAAYPRVWRLLSIRGEDLLPAAMAFCHWWTEWKKMKMQCLRCFFVIFCSSEDVFVNGYCNVL